MAGIMTVKMLAVYAFSPDAGAEKEPA